MNGFTGQIPSEISLLPKLVSVDLSLNDNLIIKPHILNDLLNNSTLLRDLALSYVDISGVLPNISASSLETLYLASCNLMGSLPELPLNLSHLTHLSLSNNKLNGTLPSWLYTLPSLEYLSLSNNMFTGNVTLESFSLPYLKSLDLSYSDLRVMASNNNHPVTLNSRYLYLASCKIKEFPESLRSMRNLARLDLSGNEIKGQIPYWAGDLGGDQLYHLDLSDNFITGLPQFQWYRLQYLFMQSNLIQGPFPTSICNMSNLRLLNISINSFGGIIPQCFGNISSSLAMIDMGNNHFQGTIPNVFEDCEGLEGLILNGNLLEGEVPSSLPKCKYLKVIDLGNNYLNGTFPHWLGDLQYLQALILRSTIFHGRIVTSSSVEFPFSSLHVLDLSHNQFLGQLPAEYFQNFNAMKNVVKRSTEPEYLNFNGLYYSIVAGVKGQELLFSKLFVDYTIVDMSNNIFEGEIPNVIGTLNSLKVLNLSHNNLNGPIPDALGKLSDIESLDLSWNKLTGEIPQSLADIKGVAVLNLSRNQLSGCIPQGNQFGTFNENSFGGNFGLCGFPLPKECEHESSPEVEGDGDVDEEESGFTWKVVMMGYGCGALPGLLIGYIMLSSGRPKWFNAIADAGEYMILKSQNRRRYVFIGR